MLFNFFDVEMRRIEGLLCRPPLSQPMLVLYIHTTNQRWAANRFSPEMQTTFLPISPEWAVSLNETLVLFFPELKAIVLHFIQICRQIECFLNFVT